MKSSAGFSLIELVVVLLIAGILAALAIPRFTDTESKATFYTEEVAAVMRFAQRQAVAQHRTVFVCVLANDIRIGYDAACTGTTPRPLGQSEILKIPQRLDAPSNVTLAASNTPFSFNALGQPNPIGGVTVTLTGAGKTVNVTGETGYVFINP